MYRFAFAAVAAATTALATPAVAQDAGATIMGNDDAAVGTVLSNDGTTVVVDTGTNQVSLGTAAFAEREGVWTLNTTQAELDTAWAAMVAEQEAALASALVVGAEILTSDAQTLGTVEELTETGVVLTHAGQPMELPKNLFTVSDDGALMVLADMAAIMTALESAS